MFFFSLSDLDVRFVETKKLTSWNPTTLTVLPKTKRVELINKKNFAAAALGKKAKTFVVYVMTLPTTSIHLSKKAYIKVLIDKQAPFKVSAKDLNYIDVFSPDLAIKLLESTRINDYVIDLVEKKQLPYNLIYSLHQVE